MWDTAKPNDTNVWGTRPSNGHGTLNGTDVTGNPPLDAWGNASAGAAQSSSLASHAIMATGVTAFAPAAAVTLGVAAAPLMLFGLAIFGICTLFSDE
jgi:hypothetical protein